MHLVKAQLLLILLAFFAANIDDVSGIEDNLNRCLDGKHHKKIPGAEAVEFIDSYHCTPWAKRSCCTNETVKKIEQDGVLTLYNMKWNHCERNLSRDCRDWFIKDTCFYECSPNIGPFIVVDKRSKKTRKERVINVPICASDCDAWFAACKEDLTCSDNWGKNWKWTQQGNQCIKECKTFSEHFQNSKNFCDNIFDRTFKYTNGKDCFTLWPNASQDGVNPNEKVAKIAEKSHERAAAVSEKVVNFLDRCVDTNYHKRTPGPEMNVQECVPWRAHACCTKNTTEAIKKDGGITLYNMMWDHCGNLSKKCRDYFIKDTCFYSCSPNLSPWIVKDNIPKKARSERIMNVPLCSDDCDGWFEACKDDSTCSDNWGETWMWSKEGNQCKLKCKRFKDYFKDPVTFCNKIFNYSFVYTSGEHGKDCMTLWPDSDLRDLNKQFAVKAAYKIISTINAAISLNTAAVLIYISLMMVYTLLD
ncbi:folate receptor beta-like [Dendronephthya gigantea]|uniref:folate receptor beta-like n=1 Tax=Dendronephthya gigantea TaxID=151771 RepID=UPI001069837F|nr:folate receptor beta-like [Dendronephthya gigantea]